MGLKGYDCDGFVHFKLGKGMATAAYEYLDNDLFIRVALAYCSPKDQFAKKRGRDIAHGRLLSKKNNRPSKRESIIFKRDYSSPAEAIKVKVREQPHLFQAPEWAK